MPPRRTPPAAPGATRTRWRSTSRPSRTARAASGSSKPASRAPGRGGGWTAGWSCEDCAGRSAPAQQPQQLAPAREPVAEAVEPEELVRGVVVLVGGGEAEEHRVEP